MVSDAKSKGFINNLNSKCRKRDGLRKRIGSGRHFEVLHCNYNRKIGPKWDLVITESYRNKVNVYIL